MTPLQKTLGSLAILLAVVPATAQTLATTGALDLKAERDRLSSERAALDRRVKAEQVACYQRFAVEDCLKDSRQRRRTEDDDLRRQEAAIRDIERKQRGAAQLDRLEQKEAPRSQAERDQAVQSQQDRE